MLVDTSYNNYIIIRVLTILKKYGPGRECVVHIQIDIPSPLSMVSQAIQDMYIHMIDHVNKHTRAVYTSIILDKRREHH